ncbi:MAG: hypothetical protein WBN92_14385 [Terriglobia bacterium]
MKKTLVVMTVAMMFIVTLIFAQAKSEQKPGEQSSSETMNCPMMGQMSHMHGEQMKGQMQHSMPAMKDGMAGMFSLSPEEINILLKSKKADLGLSDSQVKLVADLVASSQQKKADEKMQQMHQMMAQKQGDGMKCPCMGTPAK